MSAKHSPNTCSGLLMLFPNDKILEGDGNLQKPANIPALIDELGNGHFEAIQNYAEQSILKPLSDSQDKFIILVHQDEAAVSEANVLCVFSALAYDKGDTACLEEIADQYQHHDGVGHLMNNLGVMFSERMDYKRGETCFKAAKRCFEQQLDHLRSAVASLNLAFLHKLFGNYKSSLSCGDTAAVLCHDISMRTTKDVNLPWKVLRRVAGLCQELGNYKKYEDVLRIGVLYDISGTNECFTGNLTKQLMTLQLKEQNGEKIEAEELEDLASYLCELLDFSCSDNLPQTEMINADVIATVITVAKMFRDNNGLEKGCMLLEKLKTTFLVVHGKRSSLYGTLLYQIGSFELGAGKTSEAVYSLKQAEEVFIYYFGRSHHMVALCKKLLGTCALLKEDTTEASAYLNNALTLFKKMNDCHPKIAEILLKFVLLCSEEGQFESAKATIEEALNIITLACGEVSPEMASAYIQAAAVLKKVEKFRASAIDKVKKAIDIFLQLGLRCNHPDVMTCHNLLGVLQLSLGQCKEAEEQFTEVQQPATLQGESCFTTRIIAPEGFNMFFQVKNDSGTGRFVCPSLAAQVVSLVNLVDMKKGEEREKHLNSLLRCLQGHETEVPLLWDFAGQIVYYISHRVCLSDRFVYCILTSAPSSDWFQIDQGLNSEEPNLFLLSSSNGHGKNPCSLVFWKTSEVLKMKEFSCVNSAFRESVNMLFLQPKFKKSSLEGQDLYIELTLPHDLCAAFSLCSQIDYLPLLVEQELSEPHKECRNTDSVLHPSLISAVKSSTHISYFSYRLFSQHQAVLFFASLVLSLGQTFAQTKVEGVEIFTASALQNGEFFLFLEPNNSSLSVVVDEELVLVKCRTTRELESTCFCSLVRNTLEGTMASLCQIVAEVTKFELSVQLPCEDAGGDYMRESANCSCTCNDFQTQSTCSDHSLDTLDYHAYVNSYEPESDHLEGKPIAEVLQNEHEEDILFAGHSDSKIVTEVCVSFLECLLSNRHGASEVQLSGTGEMLSTDSACLNDNMQLDSSLLSPGSVSSLNSVPTSLSPSSAVDERPLFLQGKSSPLLKVAAEPICDEKEDSNADYLLNSLPLGDKLPNLPNRDNLLGDCSAMSSSRDVGLRSGASLSTGTRETVKLEDGTGLSEEENHILKISQIIFSQNQCHELKQQIIVLEEKMKQCQAEKEQLELQFGMKSFLQDKQRRSEKFLQSFRAHVSEQNKSSTECGASCAFTSVEGTQLGGFSPLHEPGISLQGRLLEISNSLSEAELRKIKFLAKPKVDLFQLRKIREGYELFEELETNGELSCTYVRELLEGIQRLDLVEKLDLPLPGSAENGKRKEDQDSGSLLPALVIVPSGDKKRGVLSKRYDAATDKTSVRIHQQSSEENDRESSINESDSGSSMYRVNLESTGGNMAVLSRNTNGYDSSMQSESSSEQHTRFPSFLSCESSSTAVSSSEVSAANLAMMAEPFTDDSTFSSCTTQDVTLDLPSAFKNHESSVDSSYNAKSSEDELLESSLLPNNIESGGMDTVKAGTATAQDEGTCKVVESSSEVWNGPREPAYLKILRAAGADTDVVGSGPLHFPDRGQSCSRSGRMAAGTMKDALPDGSTSVQGNGPSASSGVGKAPKVDNSVSDASTQSKEWERLGARPKDRSPVKMTPPAPSPVDLVPLEVAGTAVHGVANSFLARHSQDKGLHESLNQGSVEKVLTGETLSQGASYVDGMLNLSEGNKTKPYFGDCQAHVHSRPPFPILGYNSCNAVGGYAYNGRQSGLGPRPSYGYFTGGHFLDNGDPEQQFTATSIGLACDAIDHMVLSSADNTQELSVKSHCTNRMEDCSSSSDRSEVDKVFSPLGKSPGLNKWEQLGARPKNRAPVQNIRGEWSLTEQVRQKPPGVDNNIARLHCQDRIKHEDSMPQGAESVRVVDSTSTLSVQPQDVCSWEHLQARPRDRTIVQRVPMERTLVEQVSTSTIPDQPLDLCQWEQFGARPRNTAPMQRVPMDVSPVQQVRQEPSCVYGGLARCHLRGRMENDDSIPPGAETFRVADFASTNGVGAGQLDARTGGSYNEDEERLLVPLPSATLPVSIDDGTPESLDSTNNSRFAAREGIANPRVIQGIARVRAQIQRDREEQERSLRSIWPHSGLTPRL